MVVLFYVLEQHRGNTYPKNKTVELMKLKGHGESDQERSDSSEKHQSFVETFPQKNNNHATKKLLTYKKTITKTPTPAWHIICNCSRVLINNS